MICALALAQFGNGLLIASSFASGTLAPHAISVQGFSDQRLARDHPRDLLALIPADARNGMKKVQKLIEDAKTLVEDELMRLGSHFLKRPQLAAFVHCGWPPRYRARLIDHHGKKSDEDCRSGGGSGSRRLLPTQCLPGFPPTQKLVCANDMIDVLSAFEWGIEKDAVKSSIEMSQWSPQNRLIRSRHEEFWLRVMDVSNCSPEGTQFQEAA